jgi:hypothetical protein
MHLLGPRDNPKTPHREKQLSRFLFRWHLMYLEKNNAIYYHPNRPHENELLPDTNTGILHYILHITAGQITF